MHDRRSGVGLASLTIEPTGSATANPALKNSPKGDTKRLRELQRERVKELEVQLQGASERVKIGRDNLLTYIDLIRELADAELDLAETRDIKLAALERMIERLTDCETEVDKWQNAGLKTKQDVAQARAARLKAQVLLEKFKLEK